MKKLFFILFAFLMITSCTQNQKAKSFGGKAEYDLPKGTKLIDITWKGEDMWYLVRPMREGESPETYQFKEQSSFGVLEGTVILKESK